VVKAFKSEVLYSAVNVIFLVQELIFA